MGSDIVELSVSELNLIWLILFIVLLLIEIFTVGLTTIWFAGGCLAAVLANVLGAGMVLQILIFLAVSCVLLICTRPWAMKHLNGKRIKTNYESEIGKIITITEKVDNRAQTGKSVVDGKEWTVRAADDKVVLEAGSLARVKNVSGVKLMVEKYEEETK